MIIYVTTIPFLPKKRKLSKYWKALQIVKNNSKGMLFSSTSFDSFLQIFHNKYLYVDLHLYKNQYSQNWFKKHNCARRNFCLVKSIQMISWISSYNLMTNELYILPNVFCKTVAITLIEWIFVIISQFQTIWFNSFI